MKDEETIIQSAQQDDMSLPENAARELKPGEKYVPILKPDKTYPEITPYSVSLGLIMAVIFSAATAYLGLKLGQVFEAAIPIAIIAAGIGAAFQRKTRSARMSSSSRLVPLRASSWQVPSSPCPRCTSSRPSIPRSR